MQVLLQMYRKKIFFEKKMHLAMKSIEKFVDLTGNTCVVFAKMVAAWLLSVVS